MYINNLIKTYEYNIKIYFTDKMDNFEKIDQNEFI